MQNLTQDQLRVGQTILAGIPRREAVITAISDRDPGRSPVKGGKGWNATIALPSFHFQ